MPQPTPYTRATDFSAEESAAVSGRSSVRTAALDAELDAVQANLAGLNANIGLLQRDDGEARDGVVKLHTLAADVLAMFATSGGTPRGAWVTATPYAVRDLVSTAGATYICALSHTSGTFATDLAAGRWLVISATPAVAAASIAFTPTTALPQTNAQAAIEAAAQAASNVYQSGAAGAVSRRVNTKLDDLPVSPRDFGAAGNGLTDDTAAMNAALASGRPIDGGGYTYAVTGDVVLPAVCDLRNLTVKQLAPGSAVRRTLYQSAGTRLRLERVKVDRNGDGSGGSIASAGGIYVAANTGAVDLIECEVFGNDAGTGIVTVDCSDVVIDRPYVHDMTAGTSSSSAVTDDTIQGVWVIRGQRATIISPRVRNLLNRWSGQAAFAKFSRGIAVSGAKNFMIFNPMVDTVDQGVDLSGDETPEFFAVLGGVVSNCYTWGHKAANSVRNGSYVGCVSYRAGQAGFVASAPSSSTTNQTQKLDYIGCRSIASGHGGVWAAFNTAGYRVMESALYPSHPRAIRYTACTADADGATMKYGFFSDADLASGAGDNWVEAENCSVYGATVAEYEGLNQGVTVRALNTTQSVANNTWTAVACDQTNVDRMGGASGAATEFAATRSGLYVATFGAEFASSATGVRGVRVKRQGSVLPGSQHTQSALSGTTTQITTSIPVLLNKGDALTFEAFQDSGGALNLAAGSSWSVALVSQGRGRT